MPDELDLDDPQATDVALVGGKAAQLAWLRGLGDVTVPPGFVVTTAVFGASGARLTAAVRAGLGRHGTEAAYAVRSSATAEDLAEGSYAGQYESFLDVVGVDAVVDHVRRCWASLTAERALAYRRGHDGPDDVAMAVVVQRMVPADAAGVLFTADPVSGDRTVVVVEAVRGLADAFVSGRVTPDVHRLRDGDAAPTTDAAGPTRVLTDAQVVDLARLGRRIEAAAGAPRDLEWCLADGRFAVVQARPVTTLFPVPVESDDARHVYVSVGHQQMMTDAMKALGLSVWQHTTSRTMAEAGHRLFVDVTAVLASPATRDRWLETLGNADPLVRDALQTLVDRRGFLPAPPPQTPAAPPGSGPAAPPVEPDPQLVADLVAASREALAALDRELDGLTGPALFAALRAEFERAKRALFDPASLRIVFAALETSDWVADHLDAWLGERRAVDVLTRSVDHDVTAEMGLALLDVADVVRPHPGVVATLEAVAATRRTDPDVLAALDDVPGGPESRAALEGFLDRYGMRCAGEIDITRPRWREEPALVLPMLLTDVATVAPGNGPVRVAEGRAAALAARDDLVERIRALPGGARKAAEFAAAVDRLRAFIGYREYPKFDKVCRTFLYKRALWREAARLVAAGVLDRVDDVAHLRFEEFEAVSRSRRVDRELLATRRRDFGRAERLTAPRVLTSDGECLSGRHHRDDLPPGALPGLAVSTGTVEGRARVVTDLATADLAPGDVLVTRYTDPGWTPLFVAAAALVTEVGGLMTHGAVVAREYGLPAVVGVDDATTRIRDGARIRVHGTAGYVELLD